MQTAFLIVPHGYCKFRILSFVEKALFGKNVRLDQRERKIPIGYHILLAIPHLGGYIRGLLSMFMDSIKDIYANTKPI